MDTSSKFTDKAATGLFFLLRWRLRYYTLVRILNGLLFRRCYLPLAGSSGSLTALRNGSPDADLAGGLARSFRSDYAALRRALENHHNPY